MILVIFPITQCQPTTDLLMLARSSTRVECLVLESADVDQWSFHRRSCVLLQELHPSHQHLPFTAVLTFFPYPAVNIQVIVQVVNSGSNPVSSFMADQAHSRIWAVVGDYLAIFLLFVSDRIWFVQC